MAARGRRIIYEVMRTYKGYRKGNKEDIFLVGYACTFEKTHAFLGIPDESVAGSILGGVITKRKDSKFSKMGIDGTDDTIADRAGSDLLRAISDPYKMGKNVRLYTNKVITNSTVTVGTKSRHTISFLFPKWCNNVTISDVLATLIPGSSFGSGETKILPFFSPAGGRRYPILSKAQAEERKAGAGLTGADVVDTQAERDIAQAGLEGT